MPLALPPLVKETTETTGTGTLTLSGSAPTGWQTFANAAADGQLSDGDQVYYMVANLAVGPPDFEHGIGTWTQSGNTLSRDVILASSNGGSAVNWGSGTREAYVVPPRPAERPLRTYVRTLSNQSVGVGATIEIQFADELEDTANGWSSSPSPERIFVPSGYNRCRAVGQVAWGGTIETSTAMLVSRIQVGSGTGVYIAEQYGTTLEAKELRQNLSSGDVAVVGGTDFLTLIAHNNGPDSRSVLALHCRLNATFWRE
jgi:hypothetical protein